MNGLTNTSAPVPGTDVTAHFGVWDRDPGKWIYSLWSGEGESEELLSTGELDFGELPVSADQVARVAYLLDIEYA